MLGHIVHISTVHIVHMSSITECEWHGEEFRSSALVMLLGGAPVQ